MENTCTLNPVLKNPIDLDDTRWVVDPKALAFFQRARDYDGSAPIKIRIKEGAEFEKTMKDVVHGEPKLSFATPFMLLQAIEDDSTELLPEPGCRLVIVTELLSIIPRRARYLLVVSRYPDTRFSRTRGWQRLRLGVASIRCRFGRDDRLVLRAA